MGDRPAAGAAPMVIGAEMPKKSENASVETEKGFGTGLRVKLERQKPDSPEPSPAEEPVEEPAAAAEAEPEQAEEPELSETEQLWAELEDSLAREEQLRRTLEAQAKAYEEARELGRRLAERAEALGQRELQLAEQLKALETQGQRAEATPPEHGRAYLRRRIEEDIEPVWRVFQEALTATRPNGDPDFRIRLFAATTLLGEAYGATPQLSPGEQVAAARDELAGMRAKRASQPKQR
jgi:hypothetical protein